MNNEDIERRYVRSPKPESRIRAVTSTWRAYDKDGNFKGEVRLTQERKRLYEEMGFTFKARAGY